MLDIYRPQLLSRKFIKKFIKTYAKSDNWHEFDGLTADLGYGWIHYSLIRNLKPKNILCIGSKYGYIPAICALACKDNDNGMVDFVDAGYDRDLPDDQKNGRHWGGVGFWKKTNIKKHFGKFNLNNFIKTHVMTTQEFKKKNPNKKYDYLYIDGDHSYAGIKHDFISFWPKLNKGGYCSFHDIYTQDYFRSDYGVVKFWNEARRKYGGIEIGNKIGLGILQKHKS